MKTTTVFGLVHENAAAETKSSIYDCSVVDCTEMVRLMCGK